MCELFNFYPTTTTTKTILPNKRGEQKNIKITILNCTMCIIKFIIQREREAEENTATTID